jgi:PAS domain S-box-containing protein
MIDADHFQPDTVSKQAVDSANGTSQFELSHQLLNEFLNHNKALSFIKDEDGRYLYVSQSFLEFFQVSREDVLGKTDFDWLPEQVARQFVENDGRVLATGEPLEIIESVPFEHGVIRSLVCKFLIKDASGKPYIGGIAIDISRRLEAEELKARLAALVDSSHDAIIGGTPEGIIHTWNKSAERIFGYKAEEIKGQHLKVLVPEKNLSYLEDILARLKRGEETVQQEGECLRKDGELTYVSVTVSPVYDLAGQITGASIVVRDISKRKAMERALRQTSKELSIARDQALEASNLKSAFVANISHELRTPLCAILGMTELLTYGELSDEQQEIVQMLKDSSQALLSIVNDVLDLSKIEAGKMSLDTAPFNLIFLVQECARALALGAREKGLFLKTNVDHRIPEIVVGDASRVRQTLLNLIGNSIKFTEVGGITVELSSESEVEDSVSVRFSVTDTGIGISPEEQHLLFQPFTQVDGSDSRKYSGTGLGLSISKHFVEMMQGRIGVESKKGEGTVFWFVIPFKKCEQEAGSKAPSLVDAASLSSVFSGRNILLVEDNVILQKLLVKQLGNVGARVQVVSSGVEAVKAVETADFDIILMDCQLPEMDGFEATEAIRKFESDRGNRTPIIALTAGVLAGDRERCLNVGMDDYLSKPTSMKQLLEKLEIWMPTKRINVSQKC